MTHELAAGQPANALRRWRQLVQARHLRRVPRRHLAGHVAGRRRRGHGLERGIGPGRPPARSWPPEQQDAWAAPSTTAASSSAQWRSWVGRIVRVGPPLRDRRQFFLRPSACLQPLRHLGRHRRGHPDRLAFLVERHHDLARMELHGGRTGAGHSGRGACRRSGPLRSASPWRRSAPAADGCGRSAARARAKLNTCLQLKPASAPLRSRRSPPVVRADRASSTSRGCRPGGRAPDRCGRHPRAGRLRLPPNRSCRSRRS